MTKTAVATPPPDEAPTGVVSGDYTTRPLSPRQEALEEIVRRKDRIVDDIEFFHAVNPAVGGSDHWSNLDRLERLNLGYQMILDELAGR